MLADTADAGGERFGHQEVAGQFPRILAELVEVGVLVPPVKPAQEIAPVDHVEGEHPGRLEQRPGREAGTFAQAHLPGGKPGVRIDDVGGHKRVLEVEYS